MRSAIPDGGKFKRRYKMFKLGDKVKVDLTGYINVNKYKPEVKDLDGKIATITDIVGISTYRIDLDGGKYIWHDEELSAFFNTEQNVVDLAITLHENLCKLDHTDECSWYYCDAEDFSSPTKQRYYKAVKELLLNNFRMYDITGILSILKNHLII